MRSIVCVLACLMLVFGMAAGVAEPEGALRVIFFDVGKGDCILVSRDGTHVLIDTGYEATADDVIAQIREAGADSLDAVILTHYDKDHAGGADAIFRSFPAGRVYLPGYEGEGKYYNGIAHAVEDYGLPAEKVTEDVSFTLAGVKYEIFATDLAFIPSDGEKEGNDNDVSLAVAVTYEGDSFLFPGDIEAAGISAFLAAGHGTYDVVKMPHHGQNEKNSDEFIAGVRMKIAVITDSVEEPVKKKMRKQLEAIGAEMYCSSEDGRITVTGTGTGTYEVITE